MMAQLDAAQSQAIACHQRQASTHPFVWEITDHLLSLPTPYPSLAAFPALEKVVYLFNSDFFDRMQSETLIALANQAEVRTYTSGEAISEAGDTCRELLLLIEGD